MKNLNKQKILTSRKAPMSLKIHLISSFICLHCCDQYRVEIGLPENLAYGLKHGPFEELIDSFPEVLEEMEQDEIQRNIFGRFIFEHGQHDVRFLYTRVENMAEIVNLRIRHYKQVVALYQQYREVRFALNKALKQIDFIDVPSTRFINNHFYLKTNRKKIKDK